MRSASPQQSTSKGCLVTASVQAAQAFPFRAIPLVIQYCNIFQIKGVKPIALTDIEDIPHPKEESMNFSTSQCEKPTSKKQQYNPQFYKLLEMIPLHIH